MVAMQQSKLTSVNESKGCKPLRAMLLSRMFHFLAIVWSSTVFFDYLLSSPSTVVDLEEGGYHRSAAPAVFLVRSIGNVLPPWHDPEQMYSNLEFTLQHEPHFEGVEKHWVLNRIISTSLQDRLVHLLTKNGQNFTIIPFQLAEYARTSYNFLYDQPIQDIVHSYEYHSLRQDPNCANLNFQRSAWTVEGLLAKSHKKCWNLLKKRKEVMDEAMQNDKILYLTNQNVVRNKMIDIGVSSGARWVLPWDGNCFLTKQAFQDLENTLHQLDTSKTKYAYTPMVRAQENDKVLDPSYRPTAPMEEPQVIFHRSATARFHPKLRYGRRNKVELLQRLDVPGPWLTSWSPYLPWEVEAFAPLLEQISDLDGDAAVAGWVVRLSSGRQQLEREGQLQARGDSQYESMHHTLQQLDDRAVRQLNNYSPENLLFYKDLDKLRNVTEGEPEYNLIQELLVHANLALSTKPFRITDKKALPPSGNPRDYYSIDGKIQRNVKKNKKRESMLNESRYDRIRIMDMQFNTTILALAYYITGDTEYGKEAAQNVRDWFTGPNSMKPHLSFAQCSTAKPSLGILELKDLYHFLDAVRMIHRFMSDKERVELKQWFYTYLRWLDGSQRGQHAYTASNYHGVWFDVQVTAIAAYINDTNKMLSVLDRSVSRLTAQVASYGSIPNERNHSLCENDQMMFLQGWSNLGRLGESMGRNIWDEYHDGLMNMSALCRASFYAVPYFQNRHICPSNMVQENEQRWFPLVHHAIEHCVEIKKKGSFGVADWISKENRVPPKSIYEMPGLYEQDTGIAPFWQLGVERRLSAPVIPPPELAKVAPDSSHEAKKFVSPAFLGNRPYLGDTPDMTQTVAESSPEHEEDVAMEAENASSLTSVVEIDEKLEEPPLEKKKGGTRGNESDQNEVKLPDSLDPKDSIENTIEPDTKLKTQTDTKKAIELSAKSKKGKAEIDSIASTSNVHDTGVASKQSQDSSPTNKNDSGNLPNGESKQKLQITKLVKKDEDSTPEEPSPKEAGSAPKTLSTLELIKLRNVELRMAAANKEHKKDESLGVPKAQKSGDTVPTLGANGDKHQERPAAKLPKVRTSGKMEGVAPGSTAHKKKEPFVAKLSKTRNGLLDDSPVPDAQAHTKEGPSNAVSPDSKAPAADKGTDSSEIVPAADRVEVEGKKMSSPDQKAKAEDAVVQNDDKEKEATTSKEDKIEIKAENVIMQNDNKENEATIRKEEKGIEIKAENVIMENGNKENEATISKEEKGKVVNGDTQQERPVAKLPKVRTNGKMEGVAPGSKAHKKKEPFVAKLSKTRNGLLDDSLVPDAQAHTKEGPFNAVSPDSAPAADKGTDSSEIVPAADRVEGRKVTSPDKQAKVKDAAVQGDNKQKEATTSKEEKGEPAKVEDAVVQNDNKENEATISTKDKGNAKAENAVVQNEREEIVVIAKKEDKEEKKDNDAAMKNKSNEKLADNATADKGAKQSKKEENTVKNNATEVKKDKATNKESTKSTPQNKQTDASPATKYKEDKSPEGNGTQTTPANKPAVKERTHQQKIEVMFVKREKGMVPPPTNTNTTTDA